MGAETSYDMRPSLISWSGGKDSYLACKRAVDRGALPKVLLNVMNEHGDRSRSHGIPREVLAAQANCLRADIRFIESTWEAYEERFIEKLKQLRSEYDVTQAIYGDIDIQSHRDWEEKVSVAAGLQALLPIWQEGRLDLVKEMISVGIKPLIVSCQKSLADHLLGKVITAEMLPLFEELGIDACGENGEYHTLVIDGPLHHKTLEVTLGDRQDHGHYSFLNLSLKT